MIAPFTLAEAIAAIGVAEVYIGNPMVDDGMLSLGATEGTIEFTPTQSMNPLTAPELTGNVPHQATATLDQVMIKCNVILGVGLGELTGKAFRIAHMGHCNAPMVLGTLGAVEMGLKALGIPHGSGGVQAAVEHLGREVEA